MTYKIQKNTFQYFLAILIMIAGLNIFENNQQQSPNCVSAYLSGAANLSIGEGWKVNMSEMEYFSELSDEERINYRFSKTIENEFYFYNAIGLTYVVAVSRTIFFWQGDLQSLITFQQFLHVIISLIILFSLKSKTQKIFFYFLYGVNPLILYFVDFPYYYFWQIIPPSLLLVYILRQRSFKNWIFVVAIFFAIIVIIRPSTLFIVFFILSLIGYHESKIRTVLAIILCFGLIYVMKPDSVNEPWHTMYIGIGAYSNNFNIELEDSSGYKKFENETGKTTTGGCERDELYEEYVNKYIKFEYLKIVKKAPFLLLKNACLNIFQSYGFGFRPNAMIINYISAFIGLILIILLLRFSEYILLLAIGISSISFTPYYPPIPAYMFGSYILIVYSWIIIVARYCNGSKFKKINLIERFKS